MSDTDTKLDPKAEINTSNEPILAKDETEKATHPVGDASLEEPKSDATVAQVSLHVLGVQLQEAVMSGVDPPAPHLDWKRKCIREVWRTHS